MRKIPAGAEASNILVGEVDFLDKTLSAFIRLSQAGIMGDLTEVPVPTRFIFVLLGPTVRFVWNLDESTLSMSKAISVGISIVACIANRASIVYTYRADVDSRVTRWKAPFA